MNKEESVKEILRQIADGATQDDLYKFIWDQQVSEMEENEKAIVLKAYDKDDNLVLEDSSDIEKIKRLEHILDDLSINTTMSPSHRKFVYINTKNSLIRLKPGTCEICKKKETVCNHLIQHNLRVGFVVGHKECLRKLSE